MNLRGPLLRFLQLNRPAVFLGHGIRHLIFVPHLVLQGFKFRFQPLCLRRRSVSFFLAVGYGLRQLLALCLVGGQFRLQRVFLGFQLFQRALVFPGILQNALPVFLGLRLFRLRLRQLLQQLRFLRFGPFRPVFEPPAFLCQPLPVGFGRRLFGSLRR